jgi:cytochrome c1
MFRSFGMIAAFGLALTGAGCEATHPAVSLKAQDGAKLMSSLGCGACHTVPGVTGADGKVGPSLEHVGSQIYIAGMLRNSTENLQRWVQHPQAILPGNVMPDIPMSDTSAAKIVAYLQTLR